MLGGNIAVSMLTIPSNLASAQETCAHLVEHGFPDPHIYLNTPVRNPTHINQVHRNIFEGHFDIVQRFYLGPFRARRDLHLLILEDDVRVLRKDAARQIAAKIALLEQKWPQWSVLNLGCASLGPAFPVGSGFVMAMAPYSVHAYVINGRKVSTILQLTKAICRRPLFPEGCGIFPIRERFALFTPLLTQIRVPKEFLFKHIPVVKDWITYDRTLVVLMWISCALPILLVGTLLVLVSRSFRKTRLRSSSFLFCFGLVYLGFVSRVCLRIVFWSPSFIFAPAALCVFSFFGHSGRTAAKRARDIHRSN